MDADGIAVSGTVKGMVGITVKSILRGMVERYYS